MTDSKPWYASKTIWGIVLAAVVALAGMFNIQPVQDTPEWLRLALQLLGLIVATYGRLATKTTIR